MATRSRYARILEHIFNGKWADGDGEVRFRRDEIDGAADSLGIPRIKNLGDLVYSFRYRADLPATIQERAPVDREWILRSVAPGEYAFSARTPFRVTPTESLSVTKILDATPGLIVRYALTDEQAMLARLRYNRLVDTFLQITCYPLQSHLRTTVRKIQVETDDLYVGLDRRGAQYVIPVQAKGSRDRLGAVQIEQDLAMCRDKFPHLICRPIGAQFSNSAKSVIVLFEFEQQNEEVKILRERQYRLVSPEELTDDELIEYARRTR